MGGPARGRGQTRTLHGQVHRSRASTRLRDISAHPRALREAGFSDHAGVRDQEDDVTGGSAGWDQRPWTAQARYVRRYNGLRSGDDYRPLHVRKSIAARDRRELCTCERSSGRGRRTRDRGASRSSAERAGLQRGTLRRSSPRGVRFSARSLRNRCGAPAPVSR